MEEKFKCKCNGAGGAVYGMGLIGALFFYMQHVQTFWQGALGVLKALVWPAMLVYQVLQLLAK